MVLFVVLCATSWFLQSNADETQQLVLAQGFVMDNTASTGSTGRNFKLSPNYATQKNFIQSAVSFDHDQVRVPLEISLKFQTNGFFINATDEIKFRMPRLTSAGADGGVGTSFAIQQHSWATMFDVYWEVSP